MFSIGGGGSFCQYADNRDGEKAAAFSVTQSPADVGGRIEVLVAETGEGDELWDSSLRSRSTSQGARSLTRNRRG